MSSEPVASFIFNLIIKEYEQHLVHARHIEYSRIAVTSFLLAGIAALSIGYKANLFKTGYEHLLVLILIFSVFGLLISIKCGIAFTMHLKLAYKIMDDFKLGEYIYPTNNNAKLDFLSTRKLYPLFFISIISFIIFIFLYNNASEVIAYSISIVFLIILICLLFHFDPKDRPSIQNPPHPN